jgi:hypothetical protein
VNRVFAAEPAILAEFESVGIVLLVFHRVVVALFAFRARQRDLYPHFGTSMSIKFALRGAYKVPPSRGDYAAGGRASRFYAAQKKNSPREV